MYEIPRLAPIPNKDDELNFRDLMSFAFQVARGMDYLVQRKVRHEIRKINQYSSNMEFFVIEEFNELNILYPSMYIET